MIKWLLRQIAGLAFVLPDAPSPTRSFDDYAGASYAELIEAELKDEADRRQSTETRGQVVITSIGVIVGLAVAIAPLVGSSNSSKTEAGSTAASPIPAVANARAVVGTALSIQDPLIALLVLGGGLLLLIAVVFGFLAITPSVYEVAEIDAVERLTQEQFWVGPRALGSRRAAEVRARELRQARIAHARKSRYLQIALFAEVVAIVCFGAVAFVALLSNGGK